MWDALPDDLTRHIWAMRRELMLPALAARCIQSCWRRYRTLVLVGRFRMLRYLLTFREWNPSASAFLIRARL